MEYKVIDRNNWQRKEYFEHYLKEVPCTYSITTKTSRSMQQIPCSCFINDLQEAIRP